MQGFKFLTLTAVAGLCFAASAPKAQAQVSVEIGAAPQCPYGYFEAAPYGCAPTATMAPTGLQAASLLVQARGFMALPTLKVT